MDKIIPVDYANKAHWYKIPEITKEFDTFYIYSTVYFGANEGDPDYAELDNAEMLGGLVFEHAIKSSVFEESTNLFIPLYHQSSMKHAAEAFVKDQTITKEDLEANPHLKFASGETDTGVIISWHAEGPKNVEANVPIPSVAILKNGLSINPLNWKRDETYAPASMNKGSIVIDYTAGATEIRDIGGDAQVCTARGTVITNADAGPNEMTELAGPQSYHQDDYAIFYNNIKDNVAKRTAAFKASL